MAGQLQASARWRLDEPLELDWRKRVACRNRLDLPWTPESRPDVVAIIEMRALCANCPVIRECAEYGLTQPGGFYAGVWQPWAKEGARRDEEGGQGNRLSARNALRKVRDSATHVVVNAPVVKEPDVPAEPAVDELIERIEPRPHRPGSRPGKRRSRERKLSVVGGVRSDEVVGQPVESASEAGGAAAPGVRASRRRRGRPVGSGRAPSLP